MSPIELLLYLVCLSLTVVAAWHSITLGKDINKFSQQLRQDSCRLLELRYREGAYHRLQSLQKFTEATVSTTTTTMRDVHRSIAKIPFGVLESIPAIGSTTKIVRETHDMISDVVYGSILGVNKVAGKFARDAMEPQERESASEDSSGNVSH